MPLVTMRQLLDEAAKGGYGVGADRAGIECVHHAQMPTRMLFERSTMYKPVRRARHKTP